MPAPAFSSLPSLVTARLQAHPRFDGPPPVVVLADPEPDFNKLLGDALAASGPTGGLALVLLFPEATALLDRAARAKRLTLLHQVSVTAVINPTRTGDHPPLAVVQAILEALHGQSLGGAVVDMVADDRAYARLPPQEIGREAWMVFFSIHTC